MQASDCDQSPSQSPDFSTDAQQMVDAARADGASTAWDRLAAQKPQCGYCQLGLSCQNCAMGPCRIDPFGQGPQQGICGADADTLVARNLGRAIAAGASSHSDHGRDVLAAFVAMARGELPGYQVSDEPKLLRIATELGIATEGRDAQQVAADLADTLLEDFGTRRGTLSFVRRAPAARRDRWSAAGITPRGIDRENVEMLHRTHMGVDNHYASLLRHALRTGLADGWGGSMIATELTDIMLGTPQPTLSQTNLGVLRQDQVNIALHGHSPLLCDAIIAAAEDPQLLARARSHGASGINVVGLCCTGNEMLARHGVPLAGGHLMQELALVTGALEAMVVDYQCIMPSVTDVARCYHTVVISTSDKAAFSGATHIDFDPARVEQAAHEIVRLAIDAYPNRNPQRVRIPAEPVRMMAGFSTEAVLGILGGTVAPLARAVAAGTIRGIAAVVGCNNPKVPHDHAHVELTRRLVEHDVLVLVTGCAAVANGKAGHLLPQSAALAGPGLRQVCHELEIPPVLHMGSCVDNSRILTLAAALADHLGVDLDRLPLAAAAPEWHSEKATAIAAYVVASGITTVLGVEPAIFGSPRVVELLVEGLRPLVGATFAVQTDPAAAARLIRRHIEVKRQALGLPAAAVEDADVPPPSAAGVPATIAD